MTKKLVVAMSTSCLDYHHAPHNIRILRLNIHLGSQTFVDGETMEAADFQQWLISNPDGSAETAPPTPKAMTDFFLDIVEEGYDEVLVVTMSNVLSQTYCYFSEILPLLAGKMRVEVFDSKTGTFAEGFMALEAEKCFAEGMGMDDTIKRLEHLRDHNTVMFGVDDLSYLVKTGRLTVKEGMAADLLRLKPLIQVNEHGEAVVAEKVMTTRRAMTVMSDRIKKYLHDYPDKYKLYLLYSGDLVLHDKFRDLLAKRNGLQDIPAYPISPAVASHIGPRAVGFGVFWDY